METIAIIVVSAVLLFVFFKLFSVKNPGHCPYCFNDMNINKNKDVIICPFCNGAVVLESDGFYHSTNEKSIMIFEDSEFNSEFLLIIPPNKIEVPDNISFQEKVILIANTLDMSLFTLSTQMELGDGYHCYPEILIVGGKIKFVVNNFPQNQVKEIPWRNVSFFFGYNP